jgi:hypothetical protein
MSTLAESFIQLSYESGKWEKWLLPNSKANTRELAIIAGHYVFSTKECSKIKAEASRKLQKKNIDLDGFLKESVKQSILRYLMNFRLVRK